MGSARDLGNGLGILIGLRVPVEEIVESVGKKYSSVMAGRTSADHAYRDAMEAIRNEVEDLSEENLPTGERYLSRSSNFQYGVSRVGALTQFYAHEVSRGFEGRVYDLLDKFRIEDA